MKYTHQGQHAVSNHIADPQRSKTEACNADNENNNGSAFIPGSISQRQMVLVGASSIQYLANQSEDIDCGNHDTGTGNDSPRAVENICMLESTVEDCHLGNETAESWKSEIGKSGNDITDSKDRMIFINP